LLTAREIMMTRDPIFTPPSLRADRTAPAMTARLRSRGSREVTLPAGRAVAECASDADAALRAESAPSLVWY